MPQGRPRKIEALFTLGAISPTLWRNVTALELFAAKELM